MSLSKAQIDRIDCQTKLLVSGYVRKSADAYILDIPDPLILIILAFFYLMESFQSVDGDGLEISKDGLSITRVSKDGTSAYGTIEIESKSKTINNWKIKIDQRETVFVIGVIAIKADNKIEWSSRSAQYVILSQRSRCVLLCSGSSYTKLNDDIVKTGDIITMELDLNARKVTFSLNDKKFESKDLSNEISDDDLKYYLICRVAKTGDLGHQMTIVEYLSREIKE